MGSSRNSVLVPIWLLLLNIISSNSRGINMPPTSQFMFVPQICRFCWNKLRTEGNGLCPACRQVSYCKPCRNLQTLGWIFFSSVTTFFCLAGLQREPGGFQAADHGGDGSHQGGEEAERSGSSHFFEIHYKSNGSV